MVNCPRLRTEVFDWRCSWEFRIVPVTLDGSIRHLRTDDWILHPTTITVWLHDTIDTSRMNKEDVPALKERVRQAIAGPLEASPENNTYPTSAAENT